MLTPRRQPRFCPGGQAPFSYRHFTSLLAKLSALSRSQSGKCLFLRLYAPQTGHIGVRNRSSRPDHSNPCKISTTSLNAISSSPACVLIAVQASPQISSPPPPP